ncbi:MAG: peptide-methionine (S)-S-oxide reductase MsrA [Phycisphaerales bacterium]|nr:peptide-methionine (S)-S-oxide reductase MsrA [Phycisphaerales bacterium]
MTQSVKTEKAMFGAGCFWGVELTFQSLDGVVNTDVGYAGGKLDEPTYKDVCTDRTGHAEVVQIEYDPAKISYEKLLDVFWKSHDPTQVNRQGPDHGTQYRSAIFCYTAEQRETATRSRDEAQARFTRKIATEITEAPTFWPAEEYHQDYLKKRGQTSCSVGGH